MSLPAEPTVSPATLRDLYIELMKKCVTHSLWFDKEINVSFAERPPALAKWALNVLHTVRVRLGLSHHGALAKWAFRTPLIRPYLNKPEVMIERKMQGNMWPEFAHTMIGFPRLNNLESAVRSVVEEDIPGDLIEAGVWRGGACIFMRAILKAYGVTNRSVWVADSFQGLPPPNLERAPLDKGLNLYQHSELAVSLETVQSHFQAYGLLDDQVKFLKGWFKDTLPTAPIQKLAVCRLDGDLYESTMDGLVSLYPKLAVGGYLIIDDYGAISSCKQAVHDYRDQHGITEPLQTIDWSGVYWRKQG
ncbi:MAG: TylF/MycF family methyltransferase [Tepidisphaeraceae bacterium]